MNGVEWIEIVKRIDANWPHVTTPESAIAKWYDDLHHLPAEQVAVAVEASYRDGREFPPNGAQILAKVSELGRHDPDHGKAWELVNKALWKHVPDWTGFYEDLTEQAPAVAEAARRYGFETQAGYLNVEEGTVRAQFREIYKAVCRERRRDDAYAGLPSAGLRALDRNPKKLDAGKLIKTLGGPK